MGKKRIESHIHYSTETQPNQPSLDSELQSDEVDSDKNISRSVDGIARRQKLYPEREESSKDNKKETMRWVFLLFLMVWILAAIVLPVVIFCLTRNTLCLSLFANLAPPLYILYRITGYLFPRSKEEYSLQALRIQHRVNKKRI